MKKTHIPDQPRRLLRLPAVRQATGLSTSEIYRRMARNTFPASKPIGPRQVAWDYHAVQRWILTQLGELPVEQGKSTQLGACSLCSKSLGTEGAE